MGTATNGVDGGHSLGRGGAASLAGQRLGVGQIGLGHSHVEQMGVGKGVVTALGAITLEVVELGDSIAILEVGLIFHVKEAALGLEQSAVVTSGPCYSVGVA